MGRRIEVLGNGYIELIDSMGNDLAIVNAARKSFNNDEDYFDVWWAIRDLFFSGKYKDQEFLNAFVADNIDKWDSQEFSDKDRKLLKYLWDNKHTSPFEMVEFKFAVKAPMFVVRQWQRHRTWSYNEVSRRYTSEGLDFYYPEVWRVQSKDNKQASHGEIMGLIKHNCDRNLRDATECSLNIYNSMVDIGVCREQARMILPQNMMVEMVAKVDLKNLLDFLRLRDHEHAQWEIREYAKAIKELIRPIVPETMRLATTELLTNIIGKEMADILMQSEEKDVDDNS